MSHGGGQQHLPAASISQCTNTVLRHDCKRLQVLDKVTNLHNMLSRHSESSQHNMPYCVYKHIINFSARTVQTVLQATTETHETGTQRRRP